MSIVITNSKVNYGPKVVTDGLINYWDAANSKSYPGSGTIWYDLVGGNDGTLINEAIGTTTPGYMTFDSANYDYVSLSSTHTFNITSSSFSIWFQSYGDYTDTDHHYQTRGMLLGNNAPSSSNLVLRDNGSNYLIEGESNTNEDRYCMTNYDYNKYQWINLHINFINSVGATYINGEWLENNVIVDGLTVFRLGGNLSGTLSYRELLDGKIPILMYYNKHLSTNEILQNFNTIKSRFGL